MKFYITYTWNITYINMINKNKCSMVLYEKGKFAQEVIYDVLSDTTCTAMPPQEDMKNVTRG